MLVNTAFITKCTFCKIECERKHLYCTVLYVPFQMMLLSGFTLLICCVKLTKSFALPLFEPPPHPSPLLFSEPSLSFMTDATLYALSNVTFIN